MRPTDDDLRWYQRFTAAGIRTNRPERASTLLQVFQCGYELDNQILELNYGVGYVINIEITAYGACHLERAELQLPWTNQQFRWLEPQPTVLRPGQRRTRSPYARPVNQYEFPSSRIAYELERVLNDQLEHRRRLSRGDQLEGLLLGYDMGLRLGTRQRRPQKAILSLYDTLGQVVRCDLDLGFVSHKKLKPGAPLPTQPRSSLFADDDESEVQPAPGCRLGAHGHQSAPPGERRRS